MGNGPVWMTFTPLLGMSEVVRRFLQEKSPDRHIVTMTIDDVAHYATTKSGGSSPAIPSTKRKPDVKGIPVFGSGRIFPIAEEQIAIEHRDIPADTGRASADWTLVGIIHSRPLSWPGIARRIRSMSPRRTASERQRRSFMPPRCAVGAKNFAGHGRATVAGKH